VLAAGDDTASLERVLADARGELGVVARALVDLSRGQQGAAGALADVTGDKVPDALWPWALEVALRAEPTVAVRWAREAPLRPGATAVLAVGAARAALDAGDPAAARRSLAPALADTGTRATALSVLREAYERAWSGRLGTLLEEL